MEDLTSHYNLSWLLHSTLDGATPEKCLETVIQTNYGIPARYMVQDI